MNRRSAVSRNHLFLGFIIAAGCLYYVFRGLSFTVILHAFKEANPWWIVLSLVVYSAGYVTRAWRWEILMEPVKRIPARDLFAPLIIGFFANNILPFRIGELVRAHVTGNKFKISRTSSLGTILLERIFDTVAFLSTFLAVAFFLPFPPMVKKGAYVLGGGCAGAIVGLILMLRYHTLLIQFLHRTPLPLRWKETINQFMSNFTQGVSGLTRFSYTLRVTLFSLLVWIIEGTALYLIVHAFPVSFSYPQAFFLLFFLGLSVTLPQAPGYVGTVELFGTTALTLLSIPKEQALAIILTIHGTQFCFIMALGLWALWKEGLSVTSISQMN